MPGAPLLHGESNSSLSIISTVAQLLMRCLQQLIEKVGVPGSTGSFSVSHKGCNVASRDEEERSSRQAGWDQDPSASDMGLP